MQEGRQLQRSFDLADCDYIAIDKSAPVDHNEFVISPGRRAAGKEVGLGVGISPGGGADA